MLLPHKDAGFLSRVWSACSEIPPAPPATALRSVLDEARRREEDANLTGGRRVAPAPHPAGASLIISCFCVGFCLFCCCRCCFIASPPPPPPHHPPCCTGTALAASSGQNIQKVICCLMSAALCTINSLQQCPETHILPSDSSHNRGKHDPAV